MATLLLAAVCGAGGGALVVELFARITQRQNPMTEMSGCYTRLVSSLIQRLTYAPGPDYALVRSSFKDVALKSHAREQVHSHPCSASDRNAASVFAEKLANLTALVPYYVQMSRTDQRKDRLGWRDFRFEKDLMSTVSYDEVPSNALLVFIDVEYYVDNLEAFLAKCDHPVLFYTLVPTAVAHCGDKNSEFSFTFNRNNEVVYSVAGGAKYQHELWDWSGDSMMAVKRICGLPVQATTYLVETRTTAQPHHAMVLLTPIRAFNVLAAPFASLLSKTHMHRLKVVTDIGTTRLRVKDASGMRVSTGIVDGYSEITIPADIDTDVAVSSRALATGLTLATVQSRLPEADRHKAVLLLHHHKNAKALETATVFPVTMNVRQYQLAKAETALEFDAAAGLEPIMGPFISDAFAPDVTEANERAAVQGRLKDPAKHMDMVELSEWQLKCAREFSEAVANECGYHHSLLPVTFEDIWEKQNTPTQRAILQSVDLTREHRGQIQAFIKREPYGKANHPRIISPVQAERKVMSAQIEMSVAKALAKCKWYAGKKTPLEVSQRVAEVCVGAEYVCDSDVNRMDGAINGSLRHFDLILRYTLFPKFYHPQIAKLAADAVDQKIRMPKGTKDHTGTAQASGDGDTTTGNTSRNAFCAYLAYRNCYLDGQQVGPELAYEMLRNNGIYSGDDGFSANVDPATLTKAYASMGLDIRVDLIKRGSLGVKFLGRCYSPEVFYGDLSSMCDIRRTLRSLTTTPHKLPPGMTPIKKMAEKLVSLKLTDNNTPIIHEIIDACESVVGALDCSNPESRSKNAATWASRVAADVQYPNVYGEWMLDVVMGQMPNIDLDLLRKWHVKVAMSHDQRDFLSPPLLMEREPPVIPSGYVAKVDDEVVGSALADPPKVKEQKSKANAKTKRGTRGGRRARDGTGDTAVAVSLV